MKKKIITLLKPKVTSKGFSTKTIEGIADILANNLEEDASDEDIEAAIEDFMPVANLMQSENTRYANSIKSKQPNNPKGGEEKEDDPEEPVTPPVTSNNPDIAALTKLVTGLATTVNGLVQNNAKQTLQQKWETAAKAKGIDNKSLLAKWMPEDEEGFEDALADLESFAKEYSITSSNEDSTGKPAAGGGQVSSAAKKEGEAALNAWKKEFASDSKPVENTNANQ